jgi:hypothetical protein
VSESVFKFIEVNMILLRVAMLLSLTVALHGGGPDISNLNHCIEEVREANATHNDVPTFDYYVTNYGQLIEDLRNSIDHLPFIYQEAAAKPLIQFLQNLGEKNYVTIFSRNSANETLKEIISDAALAILFHKETLVKSSAFQEVVSDLYDSFIKAERRTGKETSLPIKPPIYGIIPPLVKFGNAEFGPYTWTGDATYQLLGMRCGIVSLPPAQANGGLIAWTALGHETGGHNVIHADRGLINELGQKVYTAIMKQFNNRQLAGYWANCIDESVADVCGYLNMGPSIGIGLVGYFRALGDGKLSNIGYSEGPHPIDLLRGYLAAAVVKRLHFKDALAWSEIIALETSLDNGTLNLVNSIGKISSFPVSLEDAIASTEVVAQTILRSSLKSLENHSLQGMQDWTDSDQAIVEKLILAFNTEGHLSKHLSGPGFYAAHVVAAATQAALQEGAKVEVLFSEMQNVLALMHLNNPMWSQDPTQESIALFEQSFKELDAGNDATYKAIALFEQTLKRLEEVDATSVAIR